MSSLVAVVWSPGMHTFIMWEWRVKVKFSLAMKACGVVEV
jgi:hypothetical protein